MLFKSALLTQASGSVGGITASRNRGGMYFRARAIPIDPNTPQQAVLRSTFTAIVVRWTSLLTPAERDAWDVYGLNTPITGPLGDPIILSGQQQFVRSNVPRLALSQALVTAAPAIFNLDTPGVLSADTAVQAAQTVSVNFVNTNTWANAVGGFLNIYISRPQNASINYFRGPYRFAGSAIGDPIPPASPIVITVPFPTSVGQTIFLRVRSTNDDGRLSPSTFLGPILVAA